MGMGARQSGERGRATRAGVARPLPESMRTEVARLDPVLLAVRSMGTEMPTETKQKK
jgi:hypothetical protein